MSSLLDMYSGMHNNSVSAVISGLSNSSLHSTSHLDSLTANFIGSYAIVLYIISLVTLLCIGACYYWFTSSGYCLDRPRQLNNSGPSQRTGYGHKSPQQVSSPLLFSSAGLIILLGTAGFCGLAWAMVNTTQVDAFDQALTATIAAHTSRLTLHAFSVITHLGDSATFTALCIAITLILIMGRHYLLALGCVVAIGGNSLLNVTLKAVFERGRPLHDHGLMHADGWSFPSGHSSGSVVAYGILAYLLIVLLAKYRNSIWHGIYWARRLSLSLIMLAVAIAYTVGCSRIFLQVHYASDVAAGFMSGSVWLTLCICILERLRALSLSKTADSTHTGMRS